MLACFSANEIETVDTRESSENEFCEVGMELLKHLDQKKKRHRNTLILLTQLMQCILSTERSTRRMIRSVLARGRMKK
jgi:hypothetical protein